MRLKQIGVSLLLILGFANNVYAESGSNRPGVASASPFYFFRAVMEHGGPEGNPQAQRTAEQRRNTSGNAEGNSFGSNSDGASNSQSDAAQRQGKLSPEERRALRRQIDEAGHDIYTRKR